MVFIFGVTYLNNKYCYKTNRDVQCIKYQVFFNIPLISHLTLFGTGLKIYVEWGGGGVRHHPLLNAQNHCEKQKKCFAFQIGHIEIGKVTKFWAQIGLTLKVSWCKLYLMNC